MQFSIPKHIDATIFRAYDVRGIVDETLHANDIYAIARAFASEARDQGIDEIVMAYDGRLSSELFSQALREGLCDSGCQVIDIGQVPTPVLYFATHSIASTGIMLTGSHNPKQHNGLKMVLQQQSPSEATLQHLHQRILQRQLVDGQGSYRQQDISAEYIDTIKQGVPLQRPLKVVVDCGNGVAGNIAPRLLQAMGCDVTALFCDIDGDFPNHHPDPSQEKNMEDLRQQVLAQQADVGLAFDGDGDRLGVVTNQGEMIWPDRQLMLYAIDVLARHAGAQIVFDVKCSRQLAQVIHRHGGEPVMWKTGHSHIKRKLKQSGALLAGEMSGHIFFNDDWFGFDDALYTAARLLSILDNSAHSCSELFTALPDSVNTHELNVAIDEADKFSFIQRLCEQADFPDGELITIDGLRVEFSDAWGLVRASNTTANLVLRFEADTAEALQRIQADFRQQILALAPQLQLPF